MNHLITSVCARLLPLLVLWTASFEGLWALAAQEAQDEAGAPNKPNELVPVGHSTHGEAYDEGPRQRPWAMEHIGFSHFPITVSDPALRDEVQRWFDQGNTLLHSFWYFEAERAFRWCLKLDPECAMAYWGLARSTGRGAADERAQAFLRSAVERKHTVSDRERRYIEAWERAWAPALSGAIELLEEEGRVPFAILAEELEAICIAYPEDVEAKALHLLYSLYESSRIGNDLIARSIFEVEPLHPGAHHYLIHNWDGPEGAQALDSCEVYGELASYVGHANHMPGHIYSGIGMWHDGAYWMDRATRVEKDYMRTRLLFPFNHWNHAHNRNYLSYIQEQLGLAKEAEAGARQLLAAPHDPKYNDPDSTGFTVRKQGRIALVRCLIKFEQWERILTEGTIPWRGTNADRVWRAYAEMLAHFGLGQNRAGIDGLVALRDLGEELGSSDPGATRFLERMLAEGRALRDAAQGELLQAAAILERAAVEQLEGYHRENDPPSYPRILSNVLGELYLQAEAPALAAAAFERTLEDVRNDGFALCGLVEAYLGVGDEVQASKAWGRLRFVWSDVDQGNRWWDRAAAHNLQHEPFDPSPRPQRRYALEDLSAFGPGTWEPYEAPPLAVLDTEGQTVTLDDYAGEYVLLVFYIGDRCVHCVEQLIALDERSADFRERDVTILAVSGDSVETNRDSLGRGSLHLALLSDPNYTSAKAWKSFDEFEDLELHSTNLVDDRGRVRWTRTGGDPFMDLDFLLEEIDRVQADRTHLGQAQGGVIDASSK